MDTACSSYHGIGIRGDDEVLSDELNALTVDVEDYFHVSAFQKIIDRKDWSRYRLRVENNTMRILDLFEEKSVKGTFFVLGWVAERCRRLVKEIHARGHEVACHGYGHELVYSIGPEKFREDIRKARSILEDACGIEITGYRAPSFSITGNSLWALDILIEEGFDYDSSIFPVYHDVYGMRDATPHPNRIVRNGGAIIEFPLSTLPIRFLHREIVKIPVAGGGYLRLFPLWFTKRAIRYINVNFRKPVALYFHPWEIDPEQPRVSASLKSRFRHYYNLHHTEGRVRDLLTSFRFAPMRDVLDSLLSDVAASPDGNPLR